MDLNKMSLEDILKYCKQHELWLLNLFIGNEGYSNALKILKENKRL